MKMILPDVGSTVRVTVRNPFAHAQIPPGPEFTEYQGRVLDSYRWLTDREFCMTGDSAWPTRVINLGLVRDIEFILGQGHEIATDVQTWRVTGSKGNQYTVSQDLGRWSCTCPGHGFRGRCRHVDEVSASIQQSV